MRDRSINVAVVGCGYWGPNLARNFDALPGTTLRGLFDTNPARLRQTAARFPAARAYPSLEALLADDSLDGIAVATPVQQHHSVARLCLLAGKGVLVEKPMARSSSECRDLIRLASARDLALMIGHVFLYSSALRFIARRIEEGDIGDLLYVNSQRLNFGIFQSGINVVWDLAPHDLSILLHLLGDSPTRVNCQGQALMRDRPEEVANLSLAFPKQRFATIQTSWIEPRKVRQMTFVGSEKMIVFDDLEPLEKVRIYDTRVSRPPHYRSFAEFQASYHYGDCLIPRLEQAEPLAAMCGHFIHCLREGAPPLSDGRSGHALVRILEACDASIAADGGPVDLVPAAPDLAPIP